MNLIEIKEELLESDFEMIDNFFNGFYDPIPKNFVGRIILMFIIATLFNIIVFITKRWIMTSHRFFCSLVMIFGYCHASNVVMREINISYMA